MRLHLRSLIAAACGLVATGAIAVACGGADATTAATCDPATNPSCTTPGFDGSVVSDGRSGGEVGPLPPGSTVLSDGAVLLPDGKVISPIEGIGPCTPGTTQCTNCKDDDGDGYIDWMDPECTGPLDNDESSYATGIPGDNVDPCKQDCYFDGNSGSGDDKCLWNLSCQSWSKDPKCPYDPSIVGTSKCPAPTDACKKFCAPLTPKGCDCFGCCDVYDASGKVHTVVLASTCSVAKLSDPKACPVCTKSADCGTPCGHCDICLGKTSVPADCYPAPDAGVDSAPDSAPPPPTSSCPEGLTACDTKNPCATGTYCLTGCCIKPPA